MNRRSFLLGFIVAATGGAAITSQARAAPARGLWDELQNLDAAAALDEDLPAEGASEVQSRHSRRRRQHYRSAGRRRVHRRPRGRAYGYYRGPQYRYYRRRRRVCRLVRDRWGRVVRRCWWIR
ncbi:MAG: hypothetical protein ACK4MV_03280 [Beijerinckiaceae bacterium]